MPVVIEELQADVSAPPVPAPPAAPPPGGEAGGDERKVRETIALEAWALRRLAAD